MDCVAGRLYVGLALILLLALLVSISVAVLYQGGNLSAAVRAQEQQPAIHSVGPAHPNCIDLNSEVAGERTLVITGENLGSTPDGLLQFRRIYAREFTVLIAQEVGWESSERITLDMGLIEERLEDAPLMSFWVRIADAQGEGLSNWSDRVNVSKGPNACIVPKPAPIPTPFPGSFPPSSPVRGVAGDLWADVVIGQPDFTQIAPKSVVPFKVNNAAGVVVDRSVDPGRAYVWDSGNSRILGIDLETCYAGSGPCSADIVIGQPTGYDHSACNGDNSVQHFPVRSRPTAETLCGIPDHSLSPGESYSYVTMAVDGEGNLYVPDSFNHRVLKYENPFENDAVADRLWGQVNYSGMACNRESPDSPSATSLCFHSNSVQFTLNQYGPGVEIDAAGNMWVADVGNNRVLRFSVHPTTGEIDTTADLVLGQYDFFSAEPGNSLGKMHAPSAVRFDSRGQLYIADAANDRVLVFKPPFRTGQVAAKTFGSQFHHPSSLEVDPLDRGIWVMDSANHMVELWDTTGTSVLQVLGKNSYQPDRRCGPRRQGVPAGASLCFIGGGIGIDGSGNVLVPVLHNEADVFRFPTSGAQTDGNMGRNPDRRLFYPPFEDNFRDGKGIHSARGVATWEDQLIVSDIKRLMFWNGLDTLTNGQPADGVVGDEFAVGGWPDCCGRIKVDAAGRLWALGFEGVHYLDVYQLPLNENSVPLHMIWKREATFPVLGTGEEVTLGRAIFGIAPVGRGEFLWVSDTDNHRVLRIRDPMTDPVVDVVLGQEDARGTQCNRGLFPAAHPPSIVGGGHIDVLCFPGALSIDKLGNLYVSDHGLEINGNRRLLVFSPESAPATNAETLFGPSANRVFTHSAVGLYNVWADPWEGSAIIRARNATRWGFLAAATWEPAFDSKNRMVVGYNAYAGPRFVGVYDDPLGGNSRPSTFLYDFGSMPFTATFDDNDNLYVGDINRARVLVYRNPFNNRPVPQATPPAPEDAPIPKYPAVIRSVSPGPPYCVSRNANSRYETEFDLAVEGLMKRNNFTLEFRKVTSAHREFLDANRVLRYTIKEQRISINQPWFWQASLAAH